MSALGTTATMKFADVDKVMQLTNATMKNSEEEANLLDKAMKEAASNSTFGMSDAATATLNFARAGLTAEQAASALAPAMNLAAGEGGNLDTVSAGLVATINGFHGSFDDAANYADVFAAACNNSALDIDSLSEAMSVAAPIFSTAGYEVNDAALYMGVMANNGIEAEVAANSLKTGLARLVSPAEDGAKMMDKLSISVTNADGTMKDTITIHKELNETFSKLSESEQIAAASAIFGKNQMAPWLALINTAPTDVETLSSSINNCAGTTDEMSQAMMSGFGGSIEQLKSSIDVLMTSLGQLLAEYLTPIIVKIQELVTKFNALDDSNKQTIIKIALLVAALGPLLIAIGKTISIIGALMQFISKIPTIISSAKTAFTALSGTIGGISVPVVVVVAAIAALVAAFMHLWNTNEDFKNSILSIWEQIKATFERLTSGIVERLNALGFNFESFGDVVKAVWQGLCDILAPWFEGVFTYISDKFTFVTDVILSVLDIFIGLFTGDWEQMWNGIKGIFTSIWDFIRNSFTNILNTLKGIADVFLGWFGTSWDEVWTSIKEFFINAWTNIKTFFSNTINSIKNVFVTVWDTISNTFSNIINKIKSITETVFTSVKNFITNIFTKIRDFFSTIFNAIYNVVSTTINKVRNNIVNVWNAIYNTIKPLLDAFAYLFQTIFEAIKILIGRAFDWVSDKISAIWNGIVSFLTPILESIRNTVTTVWNAIKNTICTVLDTIKTFFENIWNGIVSFLTPILESIRNTVTTVWNAIKNAVETALNAIKSVVETVWNAVSGVVSNVLNGIKSTVSNVWNTIKNTISNTMDTIKNTVSDIWDSVKSAVSNKITGIKNAIVDGFENAVNYVKGLASDAWDWGADIISGIVDGIKSKIQAVADAVTGVADTIRSYLHFSVPDIGPLTDFESWMPDFMNGLANGINKSKKLVEKEVASVAESMALITNDSLKYDFNATLSGSAQASSVVNNYITNDNSRTVNQTNNGMRQASRLELYRQVRNAVNT